MQIEQDISSYYRERIERMKNRVILQPHEICIERARLFTESYKTSKGEASSIRFAKAMEHLLSNMTINIWEDEFIVGNQCSKFVGTPLYPEVRVDTIELDLNLYNTRDVQRFLLSEYDKDLLKKDIIPYWKTEEDTVKSRFDSYLSSKLYDLMLNLLYIVDVNLTNGVGHFIPGFENVLKDGFDGLIYKAQSKLREISNDKKKSNFLNSVIIVLNGAKKFINRFSDLAKIMEKNEKNSHRKKELHEISQICSNISGSAPETFKEAIQLIYFTRIIAGLEDGGFAISIGRLDQILYPFYCNDKKKGIITDQDIEFLIKCFYLKLSTLWNYVLHKGIIAGEGPPIAINLTIGGVNRDGTDVTNELSYLLLDFYNHLKTVQPAFSIRIHQHTPDDLIVKAGEAITSRTSIAMFNDLVMIPGLNALGYSLEDAREYAPIGCVEPGHPHKSYGCTNASQLNIVKCLELTLNNGTDMFTKKKYGIENSKKVTTYEDLCQEFVNQLRYFLKNLVDTMICLEKATAELTPQPFLSATINNCIENALDITDGGAVYDFTTTQMIGLATVADSLAVIKSIVFEENLLSYEELIQLLSKNYRGTYRGKKGEEWRQLFINKVPKFGNDNDFVDIITHDIAEIFCQELRKYKNYRGGNYNPGIYSTSFHLALGVFTAASADGRKSRDPLSNGVGPTVGMEKRGPTAILNSIMKLENEIMTNGNSTLLNFHPKTMRTELFLPLIRSFFAKNGGYHIQFNVIGRSTLCDAQNNPNKYPSLVVRIAGYPVLFNELSKSAQDDIIARTEF